MVTLSDNPNYTTTCHLRFAQNPGFSMEEKFHLSLGNPKKQGVQRSQGTELCKSQFEQRTDSPTPFGKKTKKAQKNSARSCFTIISKQKILFIA